MSRRRPRRAAAIAADELRELQSAAKPAPGSGHHSDDDDGDDFRPAASKKRKRDTIIPAINDTHNDTGTDHDHARSLEQWEVDAKFTGCALLTAKPTPPTGFTIINDDNDTNIDNGNDRTMLSSGLWSLYDRESLFSMRLRERSCQKTLSAFDRRLDALIQQSHRQVFDAIKSFIASVPPPRLSTTVFPASTSRDADGDIEGGNDSDDDGVSDSHSSGGSYNGGISLIDSIIHCGVIELGVSIEDQSTLFDHLVTTLTATDKTDASSDNGADNDGGIVADDHCLAIKFQSQHCTKVDQALQYLLTSFVLHYPTLSFQSSVSLRSQTNSKNLDSINSLMEQKQRKNQFLTKNLVSNFLLWHREQRYRKLVILVEKLNAFDSFALSQLLYIVYTHPTLSAMRFIFLFGLTFNAASVVEEKLSMRVLRRMAISKFEFQSSERLVEDIVHSFHSHCNALTVTATDTDIDRNDENNNQFRFPFLLDPPSLKFLLTSYRLDHISVHAWRMAIHALTNTFYSRTPGSLLACVSHNETILIERVAQLRDSDVQYLLSLCQSDNDSGSDNVRESLVSTIRCFSQRYQSLLLTVQLLHSSVLLIPRHPQLQQDPIKFFIDLYTELFSGSTSTDDERCVTAEELLLTKAIHALPLSQLKSVVSRWQELVNDSVGSRDAKWMDISNRLNDIDTLIVSASAGPMPTTQCAAPPPATSKAKSRTAPSQRRSALLLATSIEAQSHLQPVRSAIIAFIDSLCRSFLPPIQSLPGYRLFLHSDGMSALTLLTNNNQFSSDIHRALKQASTVIGSDTNMDKCIDVSILYKLYRQSGRLINLHDFYRAYHSEATLVESNKQCCDRELLVRFYQAVQSLEWCGFLLPYKPRVDHVEKTELVECE